MQMHSDIFWTAALLINIVLLIVILLDRRSISQLKKCVKEERYKRLTPFLNLAIDRDQLALRIVNEGDTLAQNITLEDVLTIVDVGFQKKLLFRFPPIDSLKPGDSSILNIEAFEGNQPVPPALLKQLGGVLIAASFNISIRCQNMAGAVFLTTLTKEGPTCKINTITLIEHAAPSKKL